MCKTFAIVYQCGIANVFDITPRRCQKCQDRPGKDGLGRPCKGCDGTGYLPAVPKRLQQHAFLCCEWFMRGARAAGAEVHVFHCDKTGDIAPLRDEWQPGAGNMFADAKSYA